LVLVGSVLNGQDQPKEIFRRDLDGTTQAEAVAQIPDLAARLKLPPVTIHQETFSVDHRTAKKSKQRLTQSATPCYAELVITSLVYTDNVVNGRRIGSLALLRRFDGSSAAPIVREIGGSGKLTLYPASQATDEDRARLDLIDAFRQSIIQAAAKFIR
jgi:hypothetical protein